MSLPSRKVPALVVLVCCWLVSILSGLDLAVSQDFRVENRVFAGIRKKPVSRSTTIFHKGMVYDYLDQPKEVVVFDRAAGRFVLLDLARRVRASVSTEQVRALSDRIQQLAMQQSDPYLKFLGDPRFDEQFDDSSNQLTLSSEWMTYRMVLENVKDSAIARRYREFSDWYARLNTVLNPGSRPPAARLIANAALARHHATARTVHLTITPKKGLTILPIVLCSEHELVQPVVGADVDRITQTRQFMEIFQPVSFAQYRRTQDG